MNELKSLGAKQGDTLETQTRLFESFDCSRHGVFEESILYVELSEGRYRIYCLRCIADFLKEQIGRADLAFLENRHFTAEEQAYIDVAKARKEKGEMA
jgi:hypothetical protein